MPVAAAMFAAAVSQTPAQVVSNSWVYPSAANDLLYQLDERGQRITDFSDCGYRGGTVPLPDVSALIPQERWVNISPAEGDDTTLIQNAINAVAAMSPDANGWRGVVYLNAGEYQLASTIQIVSSGIVLKGAGNAAATGTRLRATDKRQYTLIDVRGSGNRAFLSGSTRNFSQKLVPAGSRTFQVSTTPDFNVGDTVTIKRPSTTQWLADIGMDQLGPLSGGDGDDAPWTAGSRDLFFDRVVTRVDGNWITVDAPLPQTFESKYGGGQIWRYTWNGRIRQVGIEDLYGIADHSAPDDENHAWTFIEMQRIENGWVRNITAQHFGYAAVQVGTGAKWLTVADSQCLDPVSIITGSRRYSFSIEGGELCLFVNNRTRGGRHDFVVGSNVPGPNAFVHGEADSALSDTGPHHRWSVGSLFDLISIAGNEINVQNRGNMGTGHGWAGAYAVVWNSKASSFRVRNPPTARNWLIGSSGNILPSHSPVGADPDGTYESSGPSAKAVHPKSLYFAQLQQRLKWPDSEHRELWLGDVDQHQATSATGETVVCDADWLSRIRALGATPADPLFDNLTGSRFTTFTFDLNPGPGETVLAASLSLSLRATGASSSDDVIFLDDSDAPLSLTSIGWQPVSATSPTVRSISVPPAQLADGRLNVAVGEDTAVDFAALHFQVGKPQPSTRTITLVAAADAHVQGGTNSGVNFGKSTTLVTKDVTPATVHREAFLRWDLTSVTGRLLDAKVRLFCAGTSQPGNENSASFVADDQWTESSITYDNRPSAGKLFAQWIPAGGQANEFSVTPQLISALATDRRLSLRIAATGDFGGAGSVSYASRETASAANRPQLVLTVENAAPSTSSISDQTTAEDQPTPALAFTVGDDDTPADSLVLSVASSNPSLVPVSQIALGGAGSDRTITLTPLADQHGSAAITISVSDGSLTTNTSFLLTVSPVDDPPVTAAGSTSTRVNEPVDIDLWTLASDIDTPAGLLWFETGDALNGTVSLLADGRTARFTPAPNYSGPATFQFTVRDTRADPRTMLNYDFQPPDLTSDGLCSDVSGNGRHATITIGGNGEAAYTMDVPGPLASRHVQSLRLTQNGNNGAARIERPLAPGTELNWGSHNWTVAGWFRRTAVVDQDLAFVLGGGNGRGGTNGFALTFGNGTNNTPLYLRNWNATGLDVDLSTTLPANTWQHLCIVREGSRLTLYSGGSAVGSDNTFEFTFFVTPPFIFGGGGSNSSSFWNRWFNGSMADIAIFRGALTPSEIAWIARAPVANFGGQKASGSVAVGIAKQPATVTLEALLHREDGTPKPAGARTEPPGLPVDFTYNGSPLVPAGAGSYAVVGTISDPRYSGSASGTLVIQGPPHAMEGNLATAHNTPVSIDMRPLAGDLETPVAKLRFVLGAVIGGSAVLDPDGHTVHFTPSTGFSGTASFDYTVIDITPDSRVFLNYDFQDSDLRDVSGGRRDGSQVIVGTGSAVSYAATAPPMLGPHHARSLFLSANGSAGAARIERSINSMEIDFQSADWTISGWFNRASSTTIDSVVQLGQSGGWGPDALSLVLPANTSQLELRNYAAGVSNLLIIAAPVGAGTWHHVAIVRDSSTITLYVNGSPAGSDSDFVISANPSSPLKLGGVNSSSNNSTWDRWFHGGLADFAVIASALTHAEVFRLATSPAAYLGGMTAGAEVTINVAGPATDTITTWRQHHFQTSENSGHAADGSDPDGDGLNNRVEYIFGTVPTVGEPAPLIGIGAGVLAFMAKPASGPGYAGLRRFYAIETSTGLSSGESWEDLAPHSRIPGEGQSVTISIPFGEKRRFYRLRSWLE